VDDTKVVLEKAVITRTKMQVSKIKFGQYLCVKPFRHVAEVYFIRKVQI